MTRRKPAALAVAALALLALACGGSEGAVATPAAPALTGASPLLGGPGAGFELCDGSVCIINGGAPSLGMETGKPAKTLWRVEEGQATDELIVRGRSADGGHSFEDAWSSVSSPGDLPGYRYYASSLGFVKPGVWILEADTGKTTATIVVGPEEPRATGG